MAERRAINVDLAALVREDGSFRTMLAWGDPVDVLEQTSTRVKVRTTDYVTQPDGSIKPQDGYGYVKRKATVPGQGSVESTAAPESVPVMKVDFVDVQQGDAAVIETPAGKVITVDGGDNQLFARYLAGRFAGTTADAPKEIDAMVVSHGDADHFAGLTQIQASEELSASQAYKRLFVHPEARLSQRPGQAALVRPGAGLVRPDGCGRRPGDHHRARRRPARRARHAR